MTPLRSALAVAAVCFVVVGGAAAHYRVAHGVHSTALGKHLLPMQARARAVADNGISSTPPELPVGGDIWPVAIYWCMVHVGDPGVDFPVAIDSGSYTLDIPLVGCDGCVHKAPNAAYDPSKSKTSTTQGQPFSNSYQTCDLKDPTAVCTIKGQWYTDEVSLAGSKTANVSFGAINYQTSNFDQFKNIDGVMGMAGPAGQTNVFNSLVSAGAFASDVWAMCLHHGSKSNGTITFGGLDPQLYSGKMEWVDNTEVGSFYAIETPSITVDWADGKSDPVQNLQSSSVLDTGTNVLLLPTGPFNSIVSILRSNCNGPQSGWLHGLCGSQKSILDGACYPFTPAQMAAYPDVSVHLSNDIVLTMKGKDYILRHPTDDGLYCFGIRVSSAGGWQIIGDTLMQEYYLAFDRANHRIGWAPVNPKTCGSV